MSRRSSCARLTRAILGFGVCGFSVSTEYRGVDIQKKGLSTLSELVSVGF